MPISREDLEKAIKSAFPASRIKITDLAGDNDHWSLEIVDEAFRNLPRIAQHKLVQAAISSHDIHALQIKTSVDH